MGHDHLFQRGTSVSFMFVIRHSDSLVDGKDFPNIVLESSHAVIRQEGISQQPCTQEAQTDIRHVRHCP